MSKRLIVILALAFVVGLAFTAYAEVQNVKISGDIKVKGVARDNFDLTKGSSSGVVNTNGNDTDFNDKDNDFLTITRVRLDADLTDNVMASVRLLNERDWNGDSRTAGQRNRNSGVNAASNAAENEIDLDLAYVTLKEFLYSPLSLTVGRQELHFGNELVVGDPDTNIFSANTQLAEGDLSARKAFDALRATLDYNPLVVDVLYAKIEEGVANLNDDVSLGGINASYALNNNTNLEGFLFSKVKGTNAAAVFNVDAQNATSFSGAGSNLTRQLKDKSDIVNTFGVRVTDKTFDNLTLDGTLAYQFGRYNPKFDPNARVDLVDMSRVARTAKRSAWALQAKAGYDLKDVALVSKYSPNVSLFYSYFSGANRDADTTKAYTGWDPMFENQTEGHIINGIFANTNMHRTGLSAKAKLTDDISANLDYTGAWFAKRSPRNTNRFFVLSGVAGPAVGTTGRQFILTGDKYIGSEVDASLSYDYTEDVKFSLLGGIFLVGNGIRDRAHNGAKGQKANATELIGSMKVTF